MRLLVRLARHAGGGAAVEFSLVMMALFLVLFGITELAWYMWTANALQQTAIQAARCMGILNPSCSSGGAYSSSRTTSFVEAQAATYGITVPDADVSLSQAATCGGASGFSQVTINYTFTTVVPNLVTGLSSVALSESSCFPNQS
jgi:Flp pilus assembly protein TadG